MPVYKGDVNLNYCVLFNPLAGKNTTKENLSSLSAIYKDNVTYYDLTRINYAEFLCGLGKDDAVILCGGDGTLNRFISETSEMNIKCDVLYYPAGMGKYTNMVTIHKGKNIHVKFDSPTALQIDGETILGVTEYKAFAKIPAKIFS